MAQQRNIVLVGSTGHGKSTLGNYFLNFGLHEQFSVGSDPEPHTKVSSVRSREISLHTGESYTFNLMDTPGLNDKDDLEQMTALFKLLIEMKEIHAVIIVVLWSAKRDENYVQTVQFYKQFLLPVFEKHQVVLDISYLSNDEYQELANNNTLESFLVNRREAFESTTGIPIGIAEIINAKPRADKIQLVLQQLNIASPNQLLGDTTSCPKKDIEPSIILHSVLARDRLLKLFFQLKPVTLTDHLFCFPPIWNTKKVNALKYVKHHLSLLSKISFDPNFGSNYIVEEIEELNQKLLIAENKLENLLGPIKTKSVYKHGDEVFYFGRISSIPIAIPSGLAEDDYIICCQKWNCEYKFIRKQDTLVVLDIVPDFLCALPHFEKGHRWFINVWIEYSGEKVFKSEMDKVRGEIAKIKVTLRQKSAYYKETEQRLAEVKAEHEKNQDKIAKYLQLEKILNKELIQLTEIADLLPLFEEIENLNK